MKVLPSKVHETDRRRQSYLALLLDFMQGKEMVSFEDLFLGNLSREFIVATFLAVLELCRLRMIRILQFETYGRLLVKNAVIMAADSSVE